PVSPYTTLFRSLAVPDRLVDRAEAQLREVLADLLGDELEEVHHELRLAAEALAQLGVLGRDPDRAGIQVADPHHDAARHHERRGRKAELLRAQKRRDDDGSACLELAVGLSDDS